KIDEEIEVVILSIDREREKIALGLKQKEKSPWEKVDDKYPVGTKTIGEVVNVMSYGAFVKLEDGIEGLVHISEMSWTKRINHPTELVNTGDEVEIVVLGINQDKQEISLGMKQTQPNPWDQVAEKYPTGDTVSGTVRNLTNYGAFVELEEGVDGLLHVSDMSWTRKISHANEMLKKGDPIECQVLSVDENRKRIALGLKQLAEDPWEKQIPEKFQPGAIVAGSVTKITNFGVFVQLDTELEGLLHISELADHKVENPEDVVQVGEELEVRILRVDSADRKIGLSRKLTPEVSETETAEPAAETAPAVREELKGGMGREQGGPMFILPGVDEPQSLDAEAQTAEAEAGAVATEAGAVATEAGAAAAEAGDAAAEATEEAVAAEATEAEATEAEATEAAAAEATAAGDAAADDETPAARAEADSADDATAEGAAAADTEEPAASDSQTASEDA
ncbi:MAG: S1 RNA-binding domain-containing protein, partial [Planctomycetaceae bacterium]